MLKFISLGSGSSGNCYLLSSDEETLLIDAGLGIRNLKKHLASFGFSLNNIHNVLITHDHADHVKSVGVICRDYDVNIYTTKEVHKGIDGNYTVHIKIPADKRCFIEKGKTFSIGNFNITPFDVPHDSTDCVGYRIEHNGTVFCLMPDIVHITDDIRRYISEANYLVIEANHDVEMLRVGNYPQYLKDRITGGHGHLSNKLCAEALCECATPNLKHVWLCHLSEENNHPELARLTVEEILRGHGIVPGVDFELEVLKRRVPSQMYELD